MERLEMWWFGELKWSATGLSTYLCLMSHWWPFRRIWRGFWVSPTYWMLQSVHWIRYTTLLDLQLAVARILKVRPVKVLCTVVPVRICWHVRQRLVPHGRLPLASRRWGGFRFALMSRSRKFFGCLYAIIGLFGKACFNLADLCKSGKCFPVMHNNFGRFGWKVVTSGMRFKVFSWVSILVCRFSELRVSDQVVALWQRDRNHDVLSVNANYQGVSRNRYQRSKYAWYAMPDWKVWLLYSAEGDNCWNEGTDVFFMYRSVESVSSFILTSTSRKGICV